jgi:hypothetical protein
MTGFGIGEVRVGVGVNVTWDLIKTLYSKIKTDLDRRISPEAREFEFDWLGSIVDATLDILAGTGSNLGTKAANTLHRWIVNIPDEFARQEVKAWLQSQSVRESAKAVLTGLLAGESTDELRQALVQSYCVHTGDTIAAADLAIRIVVKFVGDTIAGSLTDGERVLLAKADSMHSDVREMKETIIRLSDRFSAPSVTANQTVSLNDQRLVRAFRLSQKAERFLRTKFKANGSGLGELLRCVAQNIRNFDLALATTLGRFAPVRNKLMHEESPNISDSDLDRLLDEVDAALARHLAQAPSEKSLSLPSRQWFVSADGFGEFTTIAEALSRATEDDQIIVLPGVYKEAISFDKPLSVVGKGEGPDEVTILQDGDVLEIGASRVALDNITIKTTGQRAFGIVLLPGMDSIAISRCRLSAPHGDGLVAMHGSGLRLIECRFDKCRVGARLDANTAIIECRFTGNDHALLARDGTTSSIVKCEFDDNQFGLEVRGDAQVEVHDNDFRGGTYAIVAVGQPSGRIFSNRYSGFQPDHRLVKMHGAPNLLFQD